MQRDIDCTCNAQTRKSDPLLNY